MNRKHRHKTIDNARGYKEFFKEIEYFMQLNGFKSIEIGLIIHAMNSLYYFGFPVEDPVAMKQSLKEGQKK